MINIDGIDGMELCFFFMVIRLFSHEAWTLLLSDFHYLLSLFVFRTIGNLSCPEMC